ncbi:DUF3768 domain-containing protein [Coralliovum pocilloporae]|uniref:DUF3768 domain-containing protein n=1 Tax=Coralliovum pocilloporae TaxID=3066369 RepID=UPI003307C1D1
MSDFESYYRKIGAMNDAFRRSLKGGRVETTAGIDALNTYTQMCAFQLVRDAKSLSGHTDPFDERDFGAFAIGAHRLIWKIEYLDTDTGGKSTDPSNPNITTRVLKLMLADEYCREPISP